MGVSNSDQFICTKRTNKHFVFYIMKAKCFEQWHAPHCQFYQREPRKFIHLSFLESIFTSNRVVNCVIYALFIMNFPVPNLLSYSLIVKLIN